ncbi:hypothetical protein EDP1_4171 [Pseudomonas putida S610]|nr:hypothetical protein EDP1_4171 [Pseudomonas putida S610]
MASHWQVVVFADQGHGVGDLATFSHSGVIHSQHGGDLADGVGDVDRGRRAQHQVLELGVRHFGLGDTDLQLALVLEHVVALRSSRVGLGQLASLEHNGGVVAQGDGQVLVQRTVQAQGEGRGRGFIDRRLVCNDVDLYQVALPSRFVRYGGGHWRLVGHQVLELLVTRHTDIRDGLGDGRLAADIHVIWGIDADAATGGAGCDEHLGAAGQGDGHATMAGNRQVVVFADQGHGVGDLAAFGHGGVIHSQHGSDLADRVGDVDRSRAANDQVLEGGVRHFCLDDANLDLAFVLEHVVALRSSRVGLGHLASLEHNGGVVAQGNGQVLVQCAVQAQGEGRRSGFVHRHLIGDDIDLHQVALAGRFVVHGRGDRRLVRHQVFKLLGACDRDVGNRLGDRRLAADVHVIWRIDGDGASSRAGGDEYLGATGQGDGHATVASDRQVAVFADQGYGVGDLPAFDDRGVIHSQHRSDFADGVGDIDRCRCAQHQILEGSIRHFGLDDTDLDLAFVLEDVIALGRCDIGLAGLAGLEHNSGVVAQGDGEVLVQHAVQGQGEQGWRGLVDRDLVGHDVDQYQITLVVIAWRTRTWLVGDCGADRGLVQGQLLELPDIRAADRRDRLDDRIVGADVDVVRCGDSDRAGRAVSRDSDGGFAIVQGEGQRAVFVDWQAVLVVQGHGVGDLTAFGHGIGRSQFRDYFVDGVSDFHRRLVTQLQVFEGATASIGCRLDAQADFARVFINVVALCCVGVLGAGLAGLDGDLLVVAEGHDQVVGQCGIHVHGEGWLDVLCDRGLIGCNGHLDQVALVASTRNTRARLVGNLSGDRRFVERQLLELANVCASDGCDRFHNWIVRANIDVVRRGHSDRTGSAVGRDGNDGLAIVQGEGQCAVLVDRQAVFVGQGHGVGDLTTFGDRIGCGELGYNFVDGVGDFNRGIVTQLQVFEGATTRVGCRLDAQADFTRVFVDVVALSSVLIRHGSLAGLDGHLSVVAQGHDQVVGQGFVDLDGERWFDVFGNRSLVGSDGDQHFVALVTGARDT